MTQYIALIWDDESAWADPTAAAAGTAAHATFGTEHAASLRGGEALSPGATATVIRPDGAGGHTLTDGPFTETKEVLGGYYVIEAPDLDAAIEIARHVPVLSGVIELRPIMVFT